MEPTATRRPGNKGRRYPADPPRVEEIVAVMREAGSRPHGLSDLELDQGSLVVRCGKGGRRRTVGMDDWGWHQLRPWLEHRRSLLVGPLFCVINPPRPGRPWDAGAARCRLARVAADAGVRRRFAPHQLRHAHAVEMAREGVPLNVIQRQLGHANLGVTSIYLQGIDTAEIVEIVRSRTSPVISATTALAR